MRMMPTRSMRPSPAMVKQRATVADIGHVAAPLKGLSLASKLTSDGDPLTAPILQNFIVEDDRITARAGYRKLASDAAKQPIWHLIPWYGTPQALLGATDFKLIDASSADTVKSGFTSNDWHWTSFSNLSEQEYTVMVNGHDGVWSWDGSLGDAGIVKEDVHADPADSWIVPDQFHLVLSHMNRLWFADTTNLAVYYLPLQSKGGEAPDPPDPDNDPGLVSYLPLNAVFKRGGYIKAMYTWTIDGGVGLDDQLVICSSNGEAVIYSGTDPDIDMSLVGIYRFDAPMSKHSVVQYGGELYVLISAGLVPMSQILRAETEVTAEQADKNVGSLFQRAANVYRDDQGWMTFLNPSSSRLFCNIPQGQPNKYRQLVRHMAKGPVWSEYVDIPARCWGWIEPYVYFGDDDGNIYQMHPSFLNDDGRPIHVDVQMAWSQFKYPGLKQFKMIKLYMITDGNPRPVVDVKTNYDYTPGINVPELSIAVPGSEWDADDWDEAEWGGSDLPVTLTNGVAAKGHVGGPRVSADIFNCSFSISGWDVIYEKGSVLG